MELEEPVTSHRGEWRIASLTKTALTIVNRGMAEHAVDLWMQKTASNRDGNVAKL
jgi:hypothetical protein